MASTPRDPSPLDDAEPPKQSGPVFAPDGRKLQDSEYVGASAPDTDPVDEPRTPAPHKRAPTKR